MNKVTSISVAVVCALGMSAAVAQTVQRGTSVQGTAGTVGSTIVFVGAAVASVASASKSNGPVVH